MNKKLPNAQERLTSIRADIAGARKKLADMKHTIASDDVIKHRIGEELDTIVAETQRLLPYHLFLGGTSFSLGSFAKVAAELTSPSIEVSGEVITTVPPELSLFHMMATFDRVNIEKELIEGAIFFAGVSNRPRMNAQQRASATTDLQQQMAVWEKAEEVTCRELDASGKVCPRRADASPALVLAVIDQLK